MCRDSGLPFASCPGWLAEPSVVASVNPGLLSCPPSLPRTNPGRPPATGRVVGAAMDTVRLATSSSSRHRIGRVLCTMGGGEGLCQETRTRRPPRQEGPRPYRREVPPGMEMRGWGGGLACLLAGPGQSPRSGRGCRPGQVGRCAMYLVTPARPEAMKKIKQIPEIKPKLPAPDSSPSDGSRTAFAAGPPLRYRSDPTGRRKGIR